MTKERGRTNLRKLAKEVGVDYTTIVIKSKLVSDIKSYRTKNGISQRELAEKIPGLTQDRVSKIFSGQIGHMTIDKLIQILQGLNYKVILKLKKPSSKYVA